MKRLPNCPRCQKRTLWRAADEPVRDDDGKPTDMLRVYYDCVQCAGCVVRLEKADVVGREGAR